jgi:uracil-DNA glycosylase
MKINITENWKLVLKDEFEKTYFQEIISFLDHQKKLGKTIFPEESLIFNAFNQTSFEDIHVVILGQDPYHGSNQAHDQALLLIL